MQALRLSQRKFPTLAFCCMNCCLRYLEFVIWTWKVCCFAPNCATVTESSNTSQGQIYRGTVFKACEFEVIEGVCSLHRSLSPLQTKQGRSWASDLKSNCATDTPFKKHIPPKFFGWEKTPSSQPPFFRCSTASISCYLSQVSVCKAMVAKRETSPSSSHLHPFFFWGCKNIFDLVFA